jgi:surfactin synthase thioesterase subunit
MTDNLRFESVTARDRGKWIRQLGPAPDAPHRLVCFPYAGGSVSYFFRLMRVLAPEIDAVAVQYPGRQERRSEPVIDDIDELADRIAEAVGPWIDRPTAFFGHSMGAILAFEVAIRLEATGVQLTELFVSGRRGPGTFRDETTYLAGDDELLAEVARLGGTESTALTDPDIVAMVLPFLRGDYRAIERYRWAGGPRLQCGIMAFTGRSDPKASVEEVIQWRSHTAGAFEMRQFPGGHFFLNRHADALTAVIREHITGMRARSR